MKNTPFLAAISALLLPFAVSAQDARKLVCLSPCVDAENHVSYIHYDN